MDLLRDRESLNRSLIRPGAQSGAVVFRDFAAGVRVGLCLGPVLGR